MLADDPAAQLRDLLSHGDRRPGSAANDRAVDLAAGWCRDHGWQVDTPEFDVVTWRAGDGRVTGAGLDLAVTPTPYGCGVDAAGVVLVVADLATLEATVAAGHSRGAVLVLRGDLTAEPLTPAGYPFYSVAGHDRIRDLLVTSGAVAVVAVTGTAPSVAGAVAPFGLLEDGTFPIPAADVMPAAAGPLLAAEGTPVRVRIDADRRPASGRNVEARRGGDGPRVVVAAHVDTKPGTPGALDNTAGVVTLLQVAARLDPDATGPVQLVLFNGEDHFSAAGEVDYLRRNGGVDAALDDVRLMVNLDAVGHRGAATAWSAYHLEESLLAVVRAAATRRGLVEGPPWWQSDHAVFAMRGRPAVAFTSADTADLMAAVVHTPLDTADLVDVGLLTDAADTVCDIVTEVAGGGAAR